MSSVRLFSLNDDKIELVVDEKTVGFARLAKITDTPIGFGSNVCPDIIGLANLDDATPSSLVYSLEFFTGLNLLCISQEYIEPTINDLIAAESIDSKEFF
jgi:hypothetical protein